MRSEDALHWRELEVACLGARGGTTTHDCGTVVRTGRADILLREILGISHCLMQCKFEFVSSVVDRHVCCLHFCIFIFLEQEQLFLPW